MRTDVAIIGGGLGACAAALALAQHGWRVVVTEETRWLGGQLTSEAVPPDEHPWIESYGATRRYRRLRHEIRAFYRSHLPLTPEARASAALNPGNGWVSRLCHDPRVAVAVLDAQLLPHALSGRLTLLPRHRPVAASTRGDRIESVVVRSLESGSDLELSASYFIDATADGALLALAGVEHVVGAEARAETGEPHAPEKADPLQQQAVTVCFALEWLPGEDHTIEKPPQYERWRTFRPPGWPGPLLDWTTVKPETGEPLHRPLFDAPDGHAWWSFRRILDRTQFVSGYAPGDITLVNWPQHDYWFGPVLGVDAAVREQHLEEARQLSLSLVHWLQTEAPRPDGGQGYPGMRLRPDVVGGTPDGLAQAPYVREARRLRAELVVAEHHIAAASRPHGPERFPDSVGVGCYRLDLHPCMNGVGYLDEACWPYQIPLGALIPVRVENLLPGGRALGVTHVANGAFRVHPVEWNVGEAAGVVAAYCLERGVSPRAVRHTPALLDELQVLLVSEGVELSWPVLQPL